MYSYKIEQTIKAAALLHEDHRRSGAVPIPYITHLVAVMMILRDYTSDEDTLVAALLHDTLEDTDYTTEELETDFGKDVAAIVTTLTEPDFSETVTWTRKKQQYVKQLKRGPESAILVAAADKIHNFRSVVEEYHDDHLRFLQDFGKNLDERLEAYQGIANVINARLKDGIVHEFNHTFDLYKEFLINVQTNQIS